MSRFLNKTNLRALLMGMLFGAAVWVAMQVPLVRGADEWMFDRCFHYRGDRHKPQARIVIIGIDDASLKSLRKPLVFTSEELARVVTEIAKQKPKAIGIDMMIPDFFDDLPALQKGKDHDATKFAKACAEAGNVILAEKKSREEEWNGPFRLWRPKHAALEDQDQSMIVRGFVNLTEDQDHFIRRQHLSATDRTDERTHFPFALALWAKANGSSIRWSDDGKPIVADKVIPVDQENNLRINFSKPNRSFHQVSFSDVLRDPAKTSFKDAIVIIGVTAYDMFDRHPTPFANNFWHTSTFQDDGLMSGPEIHANIIATIADEAYITSVPWVTSLPMLVLLGGLAALGLSYTNHVRHTGVFLLATLAIYLVVFFAWWIVCQEAFSRWSLHIEVLPVLLLGFMVFAGNFGLRWLAARDLVRRIKPLEHVFQALKDGDQRLITVLFADVRNFTTYSNSHPGREVVALLNAYFAEAVPRIRENDGAVCLFMGDGLMAIFGVTDSSSNHALQATRAAVAIARGVRDLSAVWTKHDCPDFRIGIGIHTGPAILGAVGTTDCFDYTVIGDTVNVASRIESANKMCATTILISEQTFKELPREERKSLGCHATPRKIEVAGISGALEVHEVTV